MKKTLDYEITLSDQVAKTNMNQTASLLNVTKDAIRQMLLSGRDIYLKRIGGAWHYSEIRDWKRGPVKKKKKATKKTRGRK